jgi:hypothetical protein
MAPMLRSAVQQVMRNFITCRIKSAAVAAGGGFVIGGLVGGGIEMLIQSLTGDGKMDWAQVQASALEGAKMGALEGALLAMSPTAFYVYEVEQALQGAYDLYNVLNDPAAGPWEKLIAATGFVAQALPIISPRLAKRMSDALQQFCFPAGTEIAVENGSKPIEEIRVGDMVWAQSDQTGEVSLKRVKQLFVSVAASLVVITAGTNTIEATDEHPFWVVDQGWKAAGQVQVGDELWTRSGERIKVTEIAHKKGQFTVYNFEVEEAHAYFAGENELLVHNKCDLFKHFKSKRFQFGSNQFLLDRSDMEHFLKRHHPDYWDGSVKTKQTFFDPDLTPDDLAEIAHEVLKQNRDKLTGNNATIIIDQFKGVVNGKKYVVGINKGHIGQLYPE